MKRSEAAQDKGKAKGEWQDRRKAEDARLKANGKRRINFSLKNL